MTINEGTVLKPMDLINLGFKECANIEQVYRFASRKDITSVVLTDYNNRGHIFLVNDDCTLLYRKPFIRELDGILFESNINND
ncbi:hypothetical protein [Virgibacillus halodenitrificans]|uniref:hypothetical protein n=1 Tax=Virgibacillus halodenitrificans TaxID=1482 RepID=UPI000EF4967F|nr:hypothetical protein [Virgibacillus halodenitrificans]